MNGQPGILFLYDRYTDLDGFDPCFLRLAAETGFRTYAVNWRSVWVSEEGTSIRNGFEVIPEGGRRLLADWETVEAGVVVHRKYIWGQSQRLFEWLAQAQPNTYLSYHPLWAEITSKWSAELCFLAGAHLGLRVPRPSTYLVENGEIAEALRPAGAVRPLIFKPAYGSQSSGIWLSTPGDFEKVAARLPQEGWSRYVVQEVIPNPVLYRGKRFDLRVYALITGFDPLRYRLYREGVVRVAANEHDPERLGDYSRVMTGWSFLKRYGYPILNLPISELLDYLHSQGYKVEKFWERIEGLLGSVFRCLADHCFLLHEDSLRRRFFLTGADIMLIDQGDTFGLMFLETNDVPGLTPWGSVIDDKLLAVHRGWVTDLWSLCRNGEERSVGALRRASPTVSDTSHPRRTIVLVDTASQPLTQWSRGRNPELLKIARVLSRGRRANILICQWHQVEFHENGTKVTGPALQVADERIQVFDAVEPLAADVMLSFPASGSEKVGASDAEQAGLRRLAALGLATNGLDATAVVAQLLMEASRRGVITNAPGTDGRWGRKDQLEFLLRAYTRASGEIVRRPETYVIDSCQVGDVLHSFSARGLDCIVKPANRARAEGIHIVAAGDAADFAPEGGDLVVQELVPSPLTVNGHKSDLRCYMMIDTAASESCRLLAPIFVRLASAPYSRGQQEAEITNTSYRWRRGLPPAIYPLERMALIPEDSRLVIRDTLGRLAASLLRARHWAASLHDRGGKAAKVRARLLLWGLDVAAARTPSGLQLLLLEINPSPQLFRGAQLCDQAVESILANEYLPALLEKSRTVA